MVIAERTVGAGGAAAAADGAAADANAAGGDQNVPGDGGNAIYFEFYNTEIDRDSSNSGHTILEILKIRQVQK